MSSTHDRITEAFRAHEDLLPSSSEVLHNAHDLARTYRRRTRTAQAVGGAVLGVGLVAAAVNVPSLFHHPQDTVSNGFAAAPSAAPTYTTDQAQNEYFLKGYDYQNALQLAALWHQADVTQVKTDAGMKLLNGETLPVTPGGTPSTPEDAETSRAVTAFFGKGYDYDDAARLAQLWHTPTVWDSKVKAGKKIQNGEELPFAPTP